MREQQNELHLLQPTLLFVCLIGHLDREQVNTLSENEACGEARGSQDEWAALPSLMAPRDKKNIASNERLVTFKASWQSAPRGHTWAWFGAASFNSPLFLCTIAHGRIDTL